MDTVLTPTPDWSARPTPFEWVNLRRGGLACYDARGSLIAVIPGERCA